MSCPLQEKYLINEQEVVLTGDEEKNKILYGEYLMLDKILNAQRLLSVCNGSPANDEHLFIVIHQTYELWFKQIIYEMDLIREQFMSIAENWHSFQVLKRLNRIVSILRLLVDQVPVLETMTPMDFNEFRKYLNTASGFQSLQFRLIEIKLGLKHEYRTKYNQSYLKVFNNDEIALNCIDKCEKEPTLLSLVQNWLESTPGSTSNDFLKKYQHSVHKYLDDEALSINSLESECARQHKTIQLKQRREFFESVFDPVIHDALVNRGDRKISQKAFQAALMITIYQNEDIFMTPYQILTLLIDIDALIAKWRYSHVLLVQRMLGNLQVGTGGSSGYQYLRSTLSDRYKVFIDLCNVSTFLIPKKYLPQINFRDSLPTTCCCSWNAKSDKDSSSYNNSSEDEKRDLESSLDASI